ncbi:MAG TPA: hypothetical protein VFC19_02385 [Candidatus Limnocylindrales bacterium]|nr:hypothetical protein [Candidatus Limnocylindrales bacterium]
MRRPGAAAALLLTVLIAALVSFLVDLPGYAAGRSRPITSQNSADYVIMAGAPGLRWDDVDESTTPALWRLAQRGAIGSLAVRSAHAPTCPADGWVTLGAGNFARRLSGPVPQKCPPLEVGITQPDELGAYLPDQTKVVLAQKQLSYGAVPGALAESVRCTTAVGSGAAVAAARPFGRVDRFAAVLPEGPEDAKTLLSTCILSIVELGTVNANTPEERATQAAAADAVLARLDAQRPERSTIVIAGVSDTGPDGRLHVVAIDGPGWDGGWLTSITTGRRNGYLELIDLAPSALHMLGRAVPKRVIAGAPAAAVEGRPDDLTRAISALGDADRRASASLGMVGWFFTIMALIQILLYAAVIPLLLRSYRHAGPTGPAPPHPALVRAIEIAYIAVALVLPAAILADAVPWWRSDGQGRLFVLVTLVLTALLTALVVRLPWMRRTLLPLGAVSALAALVVCADLLTGASLQLNGVVGYSALQGGRFAGVGIVVMGVLFAGALMAAGWIAHLVPFRYRVSVVAAIGAFVVVLVGSPSLGADAGGAVALTAGVCLAAALSQGGWLTFTRLAWAVLAGFLVTLVFALIDLRRPVEQQGSLGRFLTQFGEGTASLTLNRVGVSNVMVFASSALTLLAIAAAIFAWAVLMRPWGGLKRLFGIYPAVRAAAVGIIVSTLIAGVLGGAALNAAAAAAATVLPLLTLTSLRVLEHAADRTRSMDVSSDTPEARLAR